MRTSKFKPTEFGDISWIKEVPRNKLIESKETGDINA